MQAHFACKNWLTYGQDRHLLYEKYNSPDYPSTFCMLKLADIGTRSTPCMKYITVRVMQAHFAC